MPTRVARWVVPEELRAFLTQQEQQIIEAIQLLNEASAEEYNPLIVRKRDQLHSRLVAIYMMLNEEGSERLALTIRGRRYVFE